VEDTELYQNESTEAVLDAGKEVGLEVNTQRSK
jgi:hypothetical protein